VLVDTVAEAHDQAIVALDDGRQLDAVVWLSAHLAATQRTLHIAGRRARGRANAALAVARAADHALELLLRRSEQHYSGDVLAAQLDEKRLEKALREALDRHCRAEHRLLSSLIDDLDRSALDELESAYSSALEHAPTRPHPHAPHRGLLGAAAFRVDAWRDRVMDTMDGRHVPAPRVSRQPVAPGRWGRYLLGEMEE
jgi:hypothetical protein